MVVQFHSGACLTVLPPFYNKFREESGTPCPPAEDNGEFGPGAFFFAPMFARWRYEGIGLKVSSPVSSESKENRSGALKMYIKNKLKKY